MYARFVRRPSTSLLRQTILGTRHAIPFSRIRHGPSLVNSPQPPHSPYDQQHPMRRNNWTQKIIIDLYYNHHLNICLFSFSSFCEAFLFPTLLGRTLAPTRHSSSHNTQCQAKSKKQNLIMQSLISTLLSRLVCPFFFCFLFFLFDHPRVYWRADPRSFWSKQSAIESRELRFMLAFLRPVPLYGWGGRDDLIEVQDTVLQRHSTTIRRPARTFAHVCFIY